MITIAAATLMIVVFGFVGFHRNLLYYVVMLAMTSIMGFALVDDIWHIRQRKPAMTLAHLSVFIVLTAGLFGSGDKHSAYLKAYIDKPVSDGLPFTLTLKSFTIEQYHPQLRISGENHGDWHFSVLEQYDKAFPYGDNFVEINHTGAEPAALVRAENMVSGQSVEGWVSCGSFMFDPVSLSLPDGRDLYMAKPMAKRYESKVVALDAEGHEYKFDIAVNHPARIGNWKIYQASYDMERGRWSTYSVFQCVYDPWFPIIRIGLWMILATAVLMFVTAGKGIKNGKK